MDEWLVRVLSVAVLGLCLWRAQEAAACSCAGGDGGVFITHDGLLPLDARAVVWWGDEFAGDAHSPPRLATFTVEREGAQGVREAVPFDLTRTGEVVLVAPREAMKAGERYHFTAPNTPRLRIEVSPIALAPLLLQAKVVVGPAMWRAQLIASGGTCSRRYDVAAQAVSLQLPPEARPFLHALTFTTMVGGRRWHPDYDECDLVLPGRSWRALGEDLIVTSCAKPGYGQPWDLKGMVEGWHKVTLRAELPGTAVVFEGTTGVVLQCYSVGKAADATRKDYEDYDAERERAEH